MICFNGHLKRSTVKLILLPSSHLFLTPLYPGKHLKNKTSPKWQIYRQQERKLRALTPEWDSPD